MNFGNVMTKQVLTFVALMVLLSLTFFLAHVDLGPANLLSGIIIALIKAALVAAFFMNLWESDGINRIFAIAGVFMLVVLLTLALSDFLTRGWLAMPGEFPQKLNIAQ